MEHDAVRDRVLARQGFRVMRFWASEVRGNLGGVMDQIVMALEAAPVTVGKERALRRDRSLDAASPP